MRSRAAGLRRPPSTRHQAPLPTRSARSPPADQKGRAPTNSMSRAAMPRRARLMRSTTPRSRLLGQNPTRNNHSSQVHADADVQSATTALGGSDRPTGPDEAQTAAPPGQSERAPPPQPQRHL